MTGLRTLAITVAGAVTVSIAAPAATDSGSGSAGPSEQPVYVAPLPGPLDVLREFDPPSTQFGAGHLGVDLRAHPAATVQAAAAGVVDFAGPVAGRGVVVLSHPDGIRTEYEPVRPLVRVGARVRAGEPIGVVVGHHRGCPGSCLHWGARRGDTYLDPLSLLQPLGPVVLLPDR
jgi:murein DD-endopeptidase MepM/ murein hydrolase activator NlpD